MGSSPSVRTHPDFLRLEAGLARRIASLREGGGTAPILVAATSLRQVRRLREALAERLGALLGVEILHYQALAYRILGSASAGPPPAVAPDVLLETLVRRLLDREPDLPLARYGRDRPAAIRSLLRLVTELREAGLGSADLHGVPGVDPQIGRLLQGYESALSALEAAGWSDRAGIARRARDAASGREPYLAVFAYGGYELIGVNLELLEALPTRNPVVHLVPSDPEAPAWAFARRFAERHLPSDTRPLPPDPNSPEGARPFLASARGFWNREDPPPSFDPGAVRLIHVQGPEAELTVAARKALAWIRSGVPPHEIAVLARTLDPYAALAETVFDRHGLAVDTSLPRTAARLPRLRALRLLLQVLGRDFERQPVVELVRSPLLLRPKDLPRGWRPEAWDQWSRAYGITRVASAWTRDLPWLIRTQTPPPWMKSAAGAVPEFEDRRTGDAESAGVLGTLVASWQEALETWRQCRTGTEHAAFLRKLARRWIRGFRARPGADDGVEPARRAWTRILDMLPGLEALPRPEDATSGTPSLTVSQVLDFVERALESTAVPDPAPAGVRFLDVMQARGLLFTHVCVIGFNAGLVPRRRREDPFLSDAARRALSERTGRPLAEPAASHDEEHLLWAMTVAAARTSLTVVWQSAGADGKARPVSPYLAELCRALPGSPPVRALLAGDTPWTPSRLPAHPSRAAAWLLGETSLLTREEGAVLAADSGGDAPAAVAAALGALDGDLAAGLEPGLAMIRVTEAFDGGLEYDACVPELDAAGRTYSASSLKRLGTCPLTFFFRHVLRIQPLEETTEDYRLDVRELGTHVHALLEAVFRDLREKGFLRGEDDPEALIAAGRESLRKQFAGLLDSMGRRLQMRFPLLYRHTKTVWQKELEAFLEKDLRRLAEGGHRLEGLEDAWGGTVTAPVRSKARRLSVNGYLDRVTRDGEGGWLISDYKTSGKLEKWIEPTEYLRLHKVQLPFYAVLAEAMEKPGAVAVEALGLGPAFFPDRGFVRAEPVTLDPKTFTGEIRRGFVESVAALDMLAEKGLFPFRSEFHCQWCEFRHACRHHHYPTRERVAKHSDFRLYFEVQAKTKTKPLLPETEAPA